MSLMTVLISLFSSVAMAAGFQTGNLYSATAISGYLSLQCPSEDGSPETVNAVFNCRQSQLEPVMYDYFLGPSGVDADSVELTVTRADGSVLKKTVKYDARSGKSREKFNLWENGLFSKALLSAGINQINYKLSRGGQLQTNGNFSVVVDRKKPLSCSPENRNSSSPSDCHNQLTMCGNYFENQNFCR